MTSNPRVLKNTVLDAWLRRSCNPPLIGRRSQKAPDSCLLIFRGAPQTVPSRK